MAGFYGQANPRQIDGWRGGLSDGRRSAAYDFPAAPLAGQLLGHRMAQALRQRLDFQPEITFFYVSIPIGATGNKRMSLGAIAFALTMGLSAAAQAQTTPAAPAKTAQHTRMATCNKDATGKKGDERKAFMKECLSK